MTFLGYFIDTVSTSFLNQSGFQSREVTSLVLNLSDVETGTATIDDVGTIFDGITVTITENLGITKIIVSDLPAGRVASHMSLYYSAGEVQEHQKILGQGTTAEASFSVFLPSNQYYLLIVLNHP